MKPKLKKKKKKIRVHVRSRKKWNFFSLCLIIMLVQTRKEGTKIFIASVMLRFQDFLFFIFFLKKSRAMITSSVQKKKRNST